MRIFIAFVYLFTLFLSPSLCRADAIQIVSNELPPLKFQKDGKVQGITVDILTQIMAKVGKPIDPQSIETMSWARAYEDAMLMPGTILLNIAMTEERKPVFKWVGPIYTIQLGLIGKSHKEFEIEQASEAAQYNVGTLLDTAPEQLLFAQGFPKERAYRISRTEQALKMLQAGRIDLFAHTADSSFYMMPELGIDPTKFKVYYMIKSVDLYIGFNNSFSEKFVSKLQKAFEELQETVPGRPSEYERIVGRYRYYHPKKCERN